MSTARRVVAGVLALAVFPVAAAAADTSGPIPGAWPGDRLAERVEDTYPFFSTPVDLAARGYVEEEFLLSGVADGWSTSGERVAEDVAYTTRVIVRRPVDPRRYNGTALVEWQNVTAGYDLDALWNAESMTRAGYAWVGVSAQRVGVNHLRTWSPARYGSLDVTGGGRYVADELSYDIFAQAGDAVSGLMDGLRTRTLLAIGASQSASRMTVLYDKVLPHMEPVFDGYAFVVGPAPTRVGTEPVFQILSETDVRSAAKPEDTDRFRRWEVAGAAHSGYEGQVYRQPISERDLDGAPTYDCDRPPFSRVPMHHVTAAAYDHLRRWVERGTPPPVAEPLEFEADGVTKRRDRLGLALGGIRLSQVSVPTALNTGDNSGETFCFLFGSHEPFDDDLLARLYPTYGRYASAVARADAANVRAGFLLPADVKQNVPVVFVHGQQGSAQQWQSQAKRFSSNGYADDRLHAFEYDTTIRTNDHAVAGLETFIDNVRARTGAPQVDVIAHSRGTAVMHAYLAAPERAADVRRYVNVDGRSSTSPPGGVPTMALWGSLQPQGEIPGATNVRLPHLGHTETTTSAESFGHIHAFLRGDPPMTTRVLPEPPGQVEIAGRAVLFPQNSDVNGVLEVWEVNPNGVRERLRHRTEISGDFGPLRVHGGKRHELALVRAGQLTYHYYVEPFGRSDRFIRLPVSGPGQIGDYVDRCPGRTALTVTRNREWRAGEDRLLVNGTDLMTPAIAPVARQIIAVFAFDDGCDGVSTLAAPPSPFGALPFLTAADLYLPGERVVVAQTPRGTGVTRTITVPAWPSDAHAMTVQFTDY